MSEWVWGFLSLLQLVVAQFVVRRKQEGRMTTRQGASSEKTELMGGVLEFKTPGFNPRVLRHAPQFYPAALIYIVPANNTRRAILYHQHRVRKQVAHGARVQAPWSNFVVCPSSLQPLSNKIIWNQRLQLILLPNLPRPTNEALRNIWIWKLH